MVKLNAQQLTDAMQKLTGWQQVDDEIRKQYQFEDFVQAMEFVNHVAELAEAAQHHPDINIRYNKVLLALTTHDAGGLTAKDVTLAQQIEEVVA